ncbi:MAG: phosphate acyltransferase PlsX [Lentisphaerae bacterium]|jgi:glycerol-3-phosphate acyltransferase PlsX|nr:phosphate acyltransferase PlsX [Lentisphaerota bacterium]
MSKISIAVDAMGGDFAPTAIVEGAGEALDYYGDRYHLFLVGDPGKIEDELRRIGKYGDRRLEVIPSTQVVEMGEHPVSAIRRKRDSSINVAADLVRKKRAAALFSAGNTGATVASAYFKWSMLPGIERPGIATIFPTEKSRFLLLDAGASVDCTPLNLLHYGLMGSIYSSIVMRKKSPRVGLLCNGTEDGKGNRLTQAAFKLLQDAKGMNFIGNVEGHDLFTDKVDVVVCDGFVGNVMLKSCEQLAVSLGRMVKAQIMKRLLWKLGALMAKGAFTELRKATDYSETGGAPLLGVAGACIIGHGISDAKAVRNGIHAAGSFIRLRINETITAQVKALNLP